MKIRNIEKSYFCDMVTKEKFCAAFKKQKKKKTQPEYNEYLSNMNYIFISKNSLSRVFFSVKTLNDVNR